MEYYKLKRLFLTHCACSNSDGQFPTISTGTAVSGDTSAWVMKLSNLPNSTVPTIQSDQDGSFADYHVIPSEYTVVAFYPSSTEPNTTHSIQTTYAVYAASGQPSATTTKVKIMRKSGIIYIKINDEGEQVILNMSTMESCFDTPVTFGAGIGADSNYFRFFHGTIADMEIKIEPDSTEP